MGRRSTCCLGGVRQRCVVEGLEIGQLCCLGGVRQRCVVEGLEIGQLKVHFRFYSHRGLQQELFVHAVDL